MQKHEHVVDSTSIEIAIWGIAAFWVLQNVVFLPKKKNIIFQTVE